ncbi:MAG TPA: hypothetical protein VGB63_02985 [Pedobacter sp.]
MRKSIGMFLACCLLMPGCSEKELDREKAMAILQQDGHYPRAVEYYIFCGDSQHASRVINAGLEDEGMVKIKHRVKLGDVGKEPIVSFTEKAKPYLLETSEEDQKSRIQKVKLADEELVEVTGILLDASGKTATVEYTTSFKNVTPFAKLMKTDYTKTANHQATFSQYDDGWRWERKKK